MASAWQPDQHNIIKYHITSPIYITPVCCHICSTIAWSAGDDAHLTNGGVLQQWSLGLGTGVVVNMGFGPARSPVLKGFLEQHARACCLLISCKGYVWSDPRHPDPTSVAGLHAGPLLRIHLWQRSTAAKHISTTVTETTGTPAMPCHMLHMGSCWNPAGMLL